MLPVLQEGIYYRKLPPIGNSLCIVTLRARNYQRVNEIGIEIGMIWNRLCKLKEGILSDLEVDVKHRKKGNLSILLAYGPKIFDIPGSRKNRPNSLSDTWNFDEPDASGGGYILEKSNLKYSLNVSHNHMLNDHFLLQFIADSEYFTSRAAIEVRRIIHNLERKLGKASLQITGAYTGFQSADQRNWLGFHDGVSNLKSHERPQVILINSRNLNSQDKWTLNGTYLGFLRINIELEKWEELDVLTQEKIIGREKLSGCPLIMIGKNGKPVKSSDCPVPGTSEVIDGGNEYYRDHPPYGNTVKDKILQDSHIGSVRPIDRIPIGDKKSQRIFRQGFLSFAYQNEFSNFLTGLNFVSFQNTPERLFRALTYNVRTNDIGSGSSSRNLSEVLSVVCAGIFLVPPVDTNEPFPGAGILLNRDEISKGNISKKRYLSKI